MTQTVLFFSNRRRTWFLAGTYAFVLCFLNFGLIFASQSFAADIRPDLGKLPTPTPIKQKSRVILYENPQLVERFKVRSDLISDAFNRSLLALTQKESVASAWKQFINSEDVVGIKISTAGGPVVSSHKEIIDTMIQGLISAGVKPQNIIVWDRYADLMIEAGYLPAASTTGWQCLAVQPGEGFDPKKTYFNEVVGQLIWGDLDFVGKLPVPLFMSDEALGKTSIKSKDEEKKDSSPKQISNRSYYTKIVTQRVTKLINVPVMSDHQRIGLNGAVASLALASIDNQRRFQTPAEHSGLAIAEIFSNEALRKITVLHVMDGLVAQFAGGPEFAPHYTESPGIIMLSKDPVAIDTIALARIEEWRAARTVVPIGNDAIHITQAARLGLGTSDLEKIDLVRIK